MPQDAFRLLVLTDAHYVAPGDRFAWSPARHCDRGCESPAAALADASARGGFDAVNYFTAPSLCDRPHRYCLVTLHRCDVSIEVFALGDAHA